MNSNTSEVSTDTDIVKNSKKESSSKILTVLGIIACIILAPILILNVVLIIQGFTTDNSTMPNIGGVFPLMVQSGSMSGTIEVGDLMLAHTVDDTQSFSEGDIIVYWDNNPGGTLVTHRIVEVTKDDSGKLAYRTKGDANATADTNLVYPDKIVGTYQGRIPWLGDVAMFMQTIPGLIVCVILPLALFIIYDVIRRRSIEKYEKAETAALMAELEKLKSEKAKLESDSENKN